MHIDEMSQDDKLTLSLRETKGVRKDTRNLTHIVQQLETRVASSSSRLDTVEGQMWAPTKWIKFQCLASLAVRRDVLST